MKQDDEINKKLGEKSNNTFINEAEYDRIRDIFIEQFVNTKKDIIEHIVNLFARKLLMITLGGISLIIGLFAFFLSQEKEIRKLESENVRLILKYEKEISALKLRKY